MLAIKEILKDAGLMTSVRSFDDDGSYDKNDDDDHEGLDNLNGFFYVLHGVYACCMIIYFKIILYAIGDRFLEFFLQLPFLLTT